MLETYPKFEALKALVGELSEKRRTYRSNLATKLAECDEQIARLDSEIAKQSQAIFQAEIAGDAAKGQEAEGTLADLKRQREEQQSIRSKYANVNINEVMRPEEAPRLRAAIMASKEERDEAAKKYHELYHKAKEDLEAAQRWVEDTYNEAGRLVDEREASAVMSICDMLLSQDHLSRINNTQSEMEKTRILAALIY